MAIPFWLILLLYTSPRRIRADIHTDISSFWNDIRHHMVRDIP